MPAEHTYVASSPLPVSVEEAFAYHERPAALQRLVPPWQSASIEQSDGSLQVGSRVQLRTRLAGVPVRWIAEHTRYDPPSEFADTQVAGPFAAWDHRHRFQTDDGGQTRLVDEVRYRLPGGVWGERLGGRLARRNLEAMFAYRHRVTRDDLALMTQYRGAPMTVAVSGSSGLVGSRLITLLGLLGHRPLRIVRGSSDRSDEVAAWDSDHEAAKLDGVDAVVHLAGKPIAAGRWTGKVKNQIRQSRVARTAELCSALARLPNRPAVLICASASGYYGDRGDAWLDETSSPGEGFLPEVCQQWEQACRPARDAGIRVVHARFGLVLDPAGGALPQMLTPAKFFGGALGSGRQWWSWISLDDVLGGLYHALADDSLTGPVNFVAPEPVTNREFARVLGRVIGRPATVPAPTAGLRLALGEMADALLLASARMRPMRLQQSGYVFRFTDLAATLRYCLGYQRLPSAQR